MAMVISEASSFEQRIRNTMIRSFYSIVKLIMMVYLGQWMYQEDNRHHPSARPK